MKKEYTQDEFQRLEDRLKPYFYQVDQYKDGYLPEWKDTIVVGYHKDADHEVRVIYRLKENLPTSTGSEFGSHHWFVTLMARHLHAGEFLKDKTPDEEHLRAWGKDLYDTSNEILAWFKLFDKGNTPTPITGGGNR